MKEGSTLRTGENSLGIDNLGMDTDMQYFKKYEKYLREAPGNYIRKEIALSPDIAGIRYFDDPLFGVGDAEDPLFARMNASDAANLPGLRLPGEWLPGAKSVISIFFPFSAEVRQSNQPDAEEVGAPFLHARIEGHEMIFDLCRKIAGDLEESGERALVPSLDKRFWAVETPGTNRAAPSARFAFTSAWSERHAAYVCGLGTFGLSKGLITEKGICGRFGSVITTAEFPVTERKYRGLYEYCTGCGACIRNCPVDAISFCDGKKHPECKVYVDASRVKYAPRYGCAKCQVGVPCMDRRPVREDVIPDGDSVDEQKKNECS